MSVAADRFSAAVAIVLEREGVLSDDRADPGGLTKFGIAAASHPGVDIATLTRDQAIAIYRSDYWDTNCCGEMPWLVAMAVFDCAVNQGAGAAANILQQAVGVPVDGRIGDRTLVALAAQRPEELFATIMALRAQRYVMTAGYPEYGKGWFRRLFLNTLAAAAAPTA